MTVGERIKQRRLELELSADEVAARLGKNRATIYRYENSDIENLPTTVLESLAKILETTPAYLMGWEEDFINRIKERREELNLSKKEVAKYIGVDERSINQWEAGLTDSLFENKEWIVLLADILKVSPIYILGVDISPDLANNPNAIEFYLDSNSINKYSYSSNDILLLKKYRDLDPHGKKMVDFTLNEEWERSTELAKAKEDLKNDTAKYSEKVAYIEDYLAPDAAHERTDVEITEEMRQHDEDIMDDENF